MNILCKEGCVFRDGCYRDTGENSHSWRNSKSCEKCGLCVDCMLLRFAMGKNYVTSGERNKKTAFCESCNDCEGIINGFEINNYKVRDHLKYFKANIKLKELLDIFEDEGIVPIKILERYYHYYLGQAVCNEKIVRNLISKGLDENEFPKEVVSRAKLSTRKSGRF